MPSYIANSRITHGQDRGAEKKIWNVEAGQQFDPAAMGMEEDVVKRMLDRKVIREPKNDSAAPQAKPVAAPAQSGSRTDRIARTLAEAMNPNPNARTSAAAGAVGESTSTPTTGGTQGGRAK